MGDYLHISLRITFDSAVVACVGNLEPAIVLPLIVQGGTLGGHAVHD
jgi:hypothetical protein